MPTYQEAEVRAVFYSSNHCTDYSDVDGMFEEEFINQDLNKWYSAL